MADFCDECNFEMGLCKKCHEEPACSDCDDGICLSCYLGMDDDDDQDGIAEGYENAELTLAERRAFLALPMEERRRILARQAEKVAPVYEERRRENAKNG